MQEWRRTAKIIATTFLVTSTAWLIGGAILFERMRQSGQAQFPAGLAPGSSAEGVGTLAPATMSPAMVPRLVIPVRGGRRDRLIDTFNQAREAGMRAHNAIDIMAPLGTPVIAAAAGQIGRAV